MSNINQNISQLTNYTTYEEFPYTEIGKNVSIDGKTHSVTYRKYVFDREVLKFGYCCETRAIPYPIFLALNGENEQLFYSNITGMYEFQPETFIDINEETPTKEKIEIKVDYFLAPFLDENSETKDDVDPERGFIQKVDYAFPT